METYRDILIRQVDTLQGFFDACASAAANIRGREVNANGDSQFLVHQSITHFIINFCFILGIGSDSDDDTSVNDFSPKTGRKVKRKFFLVIN